MLSWIGFFPEGKEFPPEYPWNTGFFPSVFWIFHLIHRNFQRHTWLSLIPDFPLWTPDLAIGMQDFSLVQKTDLLHWINFILASSWAAAFWDDWIFFPILEHFCPLFLQIAQMDLILPRWGLILPRIPPPTPVLYSAVTHPFQGYVHTQNTPSPTPKQPFSWPELERGQNELQFGKIGSQLGKMFEKWAKFF